ncbi:MAG: DUF4297 domain-containing protein [Rhodospirillaceae bacterium]|nr:DUF4297 domain-containing protein [Rhodospirillaceae bacterium]
MNVAGKAKKTGTPGRRKADAAAQPSPVDARPTTDPGDATARNYRYQHSYGVVLLAAASRGERPYRAIWCEQHEDFLAERSDGKFDGYQIKTSKPESGAWTLADDDLVKSIGRFVDLVADYKDQVHDLFFVSNKQCDTVTDANRNDRRRGRCPSLFLNHIRGCGTAGALQQPYLRAFQDIQAQCGCAADALFDALRRMHVVHGPSREESDAALSNEHLANVEGYGALNAQQLNECRDALVAIIYRASSLHVTVPRRHVWAPGHATDVDPSLSEKRVSIDVMSTVLPAAGARPQLKFPGSPELKIGVTQTGRVLEKKLERGGLGEQIDYMQQRERAAEYSLIEDAHRRPERYPELLQQVEQLVLGECSEAHLRVSQQTAPYGAAMLIDVQDRLRKLEVDRKTELGHHAYECLIGVAALLTRECRVWWSARFPIDDQS